MGSSISHIFDGSQDTGKDLAAPGDFVPWLDDIPNPRDTRPLSRHRNGNGCIADPRILKDKIDQSGLINFEQLVSITETLTQADLFYWEFCDFELHILFDALAGLFTLRERNATIRL
jgi:hypothetical protein